MHQRDNTTLQKEETLQQAKERKHEAVIGHYLVYQAAQESMYRGDGRRNRLTSSPSLSVDFSAGYSGREDKGGSGYFDRHGNDGGTCDDPSDDDGG